MRAVRRWLLRTRLLSLEKVRRNAEEEGWLTVEETTRRHIRQIRLRLFELGG